MRNYEYTIYFKVGYPITVWASCREEAIILAQAQRIDKGFSYKDVEKIVRSEGAI